MHRSEADGNAAGFYTEGDAGLGVPATVFSSSAANSFQEEIIKVIDDSGLVLETKATDTFTQLSQAIKILISNGGNISPILQTIANLQVDQDVQDTGVNIEFDRIAIKGASYNFNIRRHTDSSAVVEHGVLRVAYEPKNSTWHIEKSSSFDDSGVQFKLLSGSTADKVKLVYSSSDISGTSYFGELTLSNYKETRV